MAFVRSKRVGGHKYYQLVRNYREGGKHKQQVLVHLGPHDTLEAAIAAERRSVAHLEDAVSRAREEVERRKTHLLTTYAEELGGELPGFLQVNELVEERDSFEEEYNRQLAEAGYPSGGDEYKLDDRWDELWEKYYLLEMVYDYYRTLAAVKWAESLVRAHSAKLDRLLRIQPFTKFGSKFPDYGGDFLK
jgi:hypothetical protein